MLLYSIDYFYLKKIIHYLRYLRGNHTYKIEGIHFENEKIILKPGKPQKF